MQNEPQIMKTITIFHNFKVLTFLFSLMTINSCAAWADDDLDFQKPVPVIIVKGETEHIKSA